MFSSHIGAANSEPGTWSSRGWHLEIPGPITALLISLPPRGNEYKWADGSSPELAGKSSSSSERAQLSPSEHLLPKYHCMPTGFCTIMFFPHWPIFSVYPLCYFIGDLWVWEHFICRTHCAGQFWMSPYKQHQFLCITVELPWSQDMLCMPSASWDMPTAIWNKQESNQQ